MARTTKIAGRWTGMGGRMAYEDVPNLHATVLPIAGVRHIDHFLGKAIDTTINWTALDTSAAGLTTPALIADAPNGVVSIMMDATNEVQLSGLTEGDQRNWTLARGVNFEARARFTTLPTGAVISCLGLCGDHNAAVDTVAESIWFRADGSGAITVETDDTSHETSKVATGCTCLVNEWHVFRISCDDPANVLFFIDGVQVAAGTTFNMNQVAALQLQRVARIGKEAGATTVGVMEIDYMQCWQDLS
jgi:hypothetical protein